MEENLNKPNKKVTILASLLVVSLISAGAIGFFYYQSKTQNETLTNTVSSLEEKQAKDRLTIAELEKKNTDDKEVAKYSAKVGKFTLTLPYGYVIIREYDGASEGGSATNLSIGTVTKSGVVESNGTNRVEIYASSPGDGDGNYKAPLGAWIKQGLDNAGGENKKQTPITVDGVEAQVYITSVLIDSKHIFFTKDDVSYQITAVGYIDDDAGDKKELDDVIKGFKFN